MVAVTENKTSIPLRAVTLSSGRKNFREDAWEFGPSDSLHPKAFKAVVEDDALIYIPI